MRTAICVMLATLPLVLSVSGAVHAESGTGALAGSGATLTEPLSGSGGTIASQTGALLLKELRALRSLLEPSVSTTLTLPKEKERVFHQQLSLHQRDVAGHRSKCAEELRKANRDEKLSRLRLCIRGELTQDLAFLRKQRQYLSLLSGVSPQTRGVALERSDELAQAIVIFVNGIDSDVFQTTEDLSDARGKLRTLYRVPYWQALLSLRAEEHLAWLARLAKHLEDAVLSPEWNGAGESSAREAIVCLEEGMQLLRETATAADYSTGILRFREAHAMLNTCSPHIKALEKAERAEEKRRRREQEAAAKEPPPELPAFTP